ncbi:MAG: hypothetical protein U5O39_00435 [Gammaproteobacteria bacterium]|nr:hypothetical protein [Gammaproteobacteria bacterium]
MALEHVKRYPRLNADLTRLRDQYSVGSEGADVLDIIDRLTRDDLAELWKRLERSEIPLAR